MKHSLESRVKRLEADVLALRVNPPTLVLTLRKSGSGQLIPYQVGGAALRQLDGESEDQYTERAIAATPVVNGIRSVGPVVVGE